MNTIPTYAADRQRRRRYSLAVIERFLSEGKVLVDRNSKGEITAAMFRSNPKPAKAAPPRCRTTISTGTYYSHEVPIAPGLSLWQHKNLLRLSELDAIMGHRVEDPGDVDRFLTTVFRAVPLSCLKIPKPPAVIRTAISCSIGPVGSERLHGEWKRNARASRKMAAVLSGSTK